MWRGMDRVAKALRAGRGRVEEGELSLCNEDSDSPSKEAHSAANFSVSLVCF